jgi:hypothetical protein
MEIFNGICNAEKGIINLIGKVVFKNSEEVVEVKVNGGNLIY